ncbi:MAG: HMGL-like [Actinomycetota bacterium]
MSKSDTKSPEFVEVFDTTLRDGMQVEGVSASVQDKLRIAELAGEGHEQRRGGDFFVGKIGSISANGVP